MARLFETYSSSESDRDNGLIGPFEFVRLRKSGGYQDEPITMDPKITHRGEKLMEFSEEEEGLVKESWEVMKQNLSHHSLRFFSQIIEIEPATKDMFSFLKNSDEIPENNPKLKSHAVKVFKMTCESAVQLREKGMVVVGDTTLKHLGSVHRRKGVTDQHFEVVKEALLRTIKEAMGGQWSTEMGGAWATAYDQLAAAIKAEMKLDRAGCTQALT